MSVNGVEVIPSAQRLVKSLRDVGYEFATAVADLIDNSVEAKANTVWIEPAGDEIAEGVQATPRVKALGWTTGILPIQGRVQQRL